jgi:hypothetical protein
MEEDCQKRGVIEAFPSYFAGIGLDICCYWECWNFYRNQCLFALGSSFGFGTDEVFFCPFLSQRGGYNIIGYVERDVSHGDGM